MLQTRNVEKPILMLMREAETGKPFEELLVDLFEEHQNFDRMAQALKISPATFYAWLRIMGIKKRDLQLVVLERIKEARQQSSRKTRSRRKRSSSEEAPSDVDTA